MGSHGRFADYSCQCFKINVAVDRLPNFACYPTAADGQPGPQVPSRPPDLPTARTLVPRFRPPDLPTVRTLVPLFLPPALPCPPCVL